MTTELEPAVGRAIEPARARRTSRSSLVIALLIGFAITAAAELWHMPRA
ncbi:MAG TPA: hypothetical protein VF046_04400 [Gemmatimonadales bacterium]